MIYGIGTDLTDVKRIEKLHQKYGRAFAERILHPVELTDFSAAVRPSFFLAKRFAAKEAFAKAVGTGIRGGGIAAAYRYWPRCVGQARIFLRRTAAKLVGRARHPPRAFEPKR